MTGTVHYLHPPPGSISQYLRIGSTGHRQLEHLLDAGKLPPARFVADAASYDKQVDLINALQGVGAIELSAIERYRGACKDALWPPSDHARRRP